MSSSSNFTKSQYPSTSKLRHLKKIANASLNEDSLNMQKTLKSNTQNLQKYQHIFNDSSILQQNPINSHIPKGILNKTLAMDSSFRSISHKNIKNMSPLTRMSQIEKSININDNPNDFTDIEIKHKSEFTKRILDDDLHKKQKKLKNMNDVSFLKDVKDPNLTLKETSLIKEGLESKSKELSTNFYSKMFSYDHETKFEVNVSNLKEKLSPEALSSCKLPSRLLTLTHLGYDDMPLSSLSTLNRTLKSSSQTHIAFHTSQNKLLKNPNSRKDVEELDGWLKYMISQQEAKHTPEENIKNLLANTQVIYNACLKEIIRQISIDCSERGQFIQKIWDNYMGLLERALIENKKESNSKDMKNIEEIARIHRMYQREIEGLAEIIKKISEDKEKLENTVNLSRDRIKDLKRRLKTLKNENKEYSRENEEIRKENDVLLKTNLDLNIRLDEIMNEYKDKNNAYVPQNFSKAISPSKRSLISPIRLPGNGSPNRLNGSPRGNKEKIGLFTDNEASVVGHLIYFKTGEISEHSLKITDLHKIKEKFHMESGVIGQDDDNLQSNYSPTRRFNEKRSIFDRIDVKINTTIVQKEKIEEEEEKLRNDEIKENSDNSENSFENDQNDIAIETEHIDIRDIGVNTDFDEKIEIFDENTTFSTEMKEMEKMLERVLLEANISGESQRKALKEHIMMSFMQKFSNSFGLIRKITIYEQENDGLKQKYRELLIQCNEAEIERNNLDLQLKSQKKRYDEDAFTFDLLDEEINHDNCDDSKDGIMKNSLEMNKNKKNNRNLLFQAFFKRFLDDEEDEKKNMGNDNNEGISENFEFFNKNQRDFEKNEDINGIKEENQSNFKKNIEFFEENSKNFIKNTTNLQEFNKETIKNLAKQANMLKIDNNNNIKTNENEDKLDNSDTKSEGKAKELSSKINEKERFSIKINKNELSENITIKSQENSPRVKSKNEQKMTVFLRNKQKTDTIKEKKEFIEKEENSSNFNNNNAIGLRNNSTRNINENIENKIKRKAATLTKMLKPMLKTSNNRIYSINTDDANAVLIWVNSLQKSQIRPISIQTVFKFICSIYQERKKNILNSQAPLHVYCYDFFISQYGLKKIADDKLKKRLSSCLYYQEKNNRINVFCRLLGIKYIADPYDISYYLSCMKFFEENQKEPISIANNYNPLVYVTFEQAIAYLELNHKSKIHKETYSKLEAIISENKKIDMISQKIFLEFDFLMIHVLKLFTEQKDEMRKHLHDIFYSADLDQDEFIEFYEFQMLNRHIEKDKCPVGDIRKVFIEESDCIVPLTNEKALSFSKFIDISINYGLFAEEKTNVFIKNDENILNFNDLCKNQKEKLELFKLRFIKAKKYNSRYKRIIDNLEIKLMKGNLDERDQRIALISYRLVDEESKRIIIELELESLIPSEIRELTYIYQESAFDSEF